MGEDTYIIAGLGNPGGTYAGTRHNIGFWLVDELAADWQCPLLPGKGESAFVRTARFGKKICLLKPLTYMNLSGRAVGHFVDFYKVPLRRLLVIHDDLDMKPGRIKLVEGGGHGGHNGIRSLIHHLGAKDFFRLKIGIGRPGQGAAHPDMAVEDYVLSRFSEEDGAVIFGRKAAMLKGIETFLQEDVAGAMNLLNSLK